MSITNKNSIDNKGFEPLSEKSASNQLINVEKLLGSQPRSGFSKASEAIGKVALAPILGIGGIVGGAVVGTAAAAIGIVGATGVLAGSAALVAAGVALAATSILVGSPLLLVGGAFLLGYKIGDALKTKNDVKVSNEETPIKDFCKNQACKIGGQITKFFSQHTLETMPAINLEAEAISKRAEIFKEINQNPQYVKSLISDSDRKFIVSMPENKVNLTDGEINRIVDIHSKMIVREEAINALMGLVSISEGKMILDDIDGKIPREAKAKLQGLINKMTPNDTPSKPLTRDEVKEAMLIIGKIKEKKEIYAKLGEVGKYFLGEYKKDEKKVAGRDGNMEIKHQSDENGLAVFTERVLNFRERNKDVFISKKDFDSVNDLYDYYLAVKPDSNINELKEGSFKYSSEHIKANMNLGEDGNNDKLGKGLYLDYKERVLLKNKVEPNLQLMNVDVKKKDVKQPIFRGKPFAIEGSSQLAEIDKIKSVVSKDHFKDKLVEIESFDDFDSKLDELEKGNKRPLTDLLVSHMHKDEIDESKRVEMETFEHLINDTLNWGSINQDEEYVDDLEGDVIDIDQLMDELKYVDEDGELKKLIEDTDLLLKKNPDVGYIEKAELDEKKRLENEAFDLLIQNISNKVDSKEQDDKNVDEIPNAEYLDEDDVIDFDQLMAGLNHVDEDQELTKLIADTNALLKKNPDIDQNKKNGDVIPNAENLDEDEAKTTSEFAEANSALDQIEKEVKVSQDISEEEIVTPPFKISTQEDLDLYIDLLNEEFKHVGNVKKDNESLVNEEDELKVLDDFKFKLLINKYEKLTQRPIVEKSDDSDANEILLELPDISEKPIPKPRMMGGLVEKGNDFLIRSDSLKQSLNEESSDYNFRMKKFMENRKKDLNKGQDNLL